MKYIFGFIVFSVIVNVGFSQVKMQKEEGGLLFTEDGENVLFYQMDPKSKDGKYERCNYIHPLWGPDGSVLTEDFPNDHLHHRGIFWAWHQVWIGDERIGDPWEIKDFNQRVTDVEFISKAGGIAVLNTQVDWMSPKWKREGREIPYMNEKTTITIYPENGNYRKIDFEIHLLAAEDNLRIGGSEDVKGYSGFSVRMKLPGDVTFTGPNGVVEPQNEAVQSPGYIDISGSILKDDRKGGIVILDNPENPGYPQPWILRAKNSMQNAAWPGNTTVPVSKTEPVVLKYSLLVYSGNLSEKKIQRIQRR